MPNTGRDAQTDASRDGSDRKDRDAYGYEYAFGPQNLADEAAVDRAAGRGTVGTRD